MFCKCSADDHGREGGREKLNTCQRALAGQTAGTAARRALLVGARASNTEKLKAEKEKVGSWQLAVFRKKRGDFLPGRHGGLKRERGRSEG